MSAWTFAGGDLEPDAGAGLGGRGALRYGGWTAALAAAGAASWFFLFAMGALPTLGAVEGSERHGANLVRLADQSSFGLSTMYAGRGQRLWWDYDVAVQGAGGVRLRIAKSPPSRAFIVRFQDVARTGRGRFELIAPEAGFYSFSQELIPQGNLLGNGQAGETRYDLSWGID
ncbi:MAG: hypothetical protein QOJ53_1115 [Sphingomonadales bacterium]|jgi:hypothetical protein|nr:hypothetical protein [Sphingomonadales bacterium]MEA3046783.1 hypothetical protein [Sphingomonadales bacterium]